jgi:adenylylsulfate kinase
MRGRGEGIHGVSSPYEAPEKPELVVDTGGQPLADCVAQVMAALRVRGVVG